MRIEAPEVKREDGSKFKIVIDISEKGFSNLCWSLADVLTKEPRKRTWVSQSVKIGESFRYSGTPYGERFKITQQKLLDLVGEEEIKKAFQYAYDYIKPDVLKEVF